MRHRRRAVNIPVAPVAKTTTGVLEEMGWGRAFFWRDTTPGPHSSSQMVKRIPCMRSTTWCFMRSSSVSWAYSAPET